MRCELCWLANQLSIVPAGDHYPARPDASSVAGMGERTVQTKKSKLRTVALLGAGLLAAVGIVLLAIHLLAGPKTMTFKAYVDGVDVVKLSGKNLWIEHLYDQLPSRMSINGKKWNPVWDKNTSADYELHPAFKPSNADNVKLTKRTGRGAVFIMEKPTDENGGTLAIRVHDGGIAGADWYEFTVSW